MSDPRSDRGLPVTPAREAPRPDLQEIDDLLAMRDQPIADGETRQTSTLQETLWMHLRTLRAALPAAVAPAEPTLDEMQTWIYEVASTGRFPWLTADERHQLAETLLAKLRSRAPAVAAPPEQPQHGDPQEGDLCMAVRRYLSYVADVRAGLVKRLDRDVVLTYAAQMERFL